MERIIKIHKGLDLNLIGKAENKITTSPKAECYGLVPDDFHGIKPKLVVKEGDYVEAGTPIFVDKRSEKINFVSPVSGTIKKIERGERRKILFISILPETENKFKSFSAPNFQTCSPKELKEFLLLTGMFAFFRSRPYDIVARPEDKPKAIFVSAFSKMPLAANFTVVMKGHETEFQTGISALNKIAPVHLGIRKDQITELANIENAEVTIFDGPNPSGNVGVQINHISPINKGEVVWTLGAEEVIFLGRLLRTGQMDQTRTIAVAGAQVERPEYVQTIVGAEISSILNGNLKTEEDTRIINGNPLVGQKASLKDFLRAHVTEICCIPEGENTHEILGWIKPRINDYSTSKSYFSWLFNKKHSFNLDCRVKGSERNIIMSGEYDKMLPMDIYANYLIKAILTGDIDKQEALGIYEVAPEDFAVAEFADSSKLELQRIVREGLDILLKENE